MYSHSIAFKYLVIKKRLCQIGFTSKKASNHFAKFKQVKRLAVITLGKSQNLLVTVTYLDFFWAGRLHLGVSPPPFRHLGWQKFLNLMPPDALKMHSLAVPVLRFLVKHFLNYVNWITKHSSPWMFKKNFQIKS